MKDRKKLFCRRLTKFLNESLWPEFDDLLSSYGEVRTIEDDSLPTGVQERFVKVTMGKQDVPIERQWPSGTEDHQ